MSAGAIIDFRLRVPTAPFDASLAASHEAVWWHTRTTPLWRDESHPDEPARPRTFDACVEWMRDHHPEEFAIRYAGRRTHLGYHPHP